jgi:hypothetical protein
MAILHKFSVAFRAMTAKQHLIYWIMPLIFIFCLSLAYFSGPGWIQDLIAPPINREFGLLENIQNILLVSILLTCFVLFIKENRSLVKTIFLVCVLGSTFMLLEEIDYGYHYINYVNGIATGDDPVVHNLHNQEKHVNNNLMKICYIFLGLFFVIFPYLERDKLPAWLQRLVPSPRLQFSVFVLLLISRFPFLLNKGNFTTNGALYDNLTEFEEVSIYYLFLLYFIELYKKQRLKVRHADQTLYYAESFQMTEQYSKQD